MDNFQLRQITESIRQYLLEHPGAGDSVTGIHRWWVRWPRSPGPISLTEQALEALRADGVVRCRYGIWSREDGSSPAAPGEVAGRGP